MSGVATVAPKFALALPDTAATMDFAWRPDGKVLASAGHDGKVCLTSLGGQALCRPFFRGWIEHLAWSPDGAHLAVGTGKVVHVVDASGDSVTAMTASERWRRWPGCLATSSRSQAMAA